MQIGLVAHGNPTGIHYTGEQNIFAMSMDFVWAGKKLPAELFRI